MQLRSNNTTCYLTTNTSQPTAIKFTTTSTNQPSKIHTPQPTETTTPTNSPTPDHFSEDFPTSEIDYVIPLTLRYLSKEKAIFFFEFKKPSFGKLEFRDLETKIQGELTCNGNPHYI